MGLLGWFLCGSGGDEEEEEGWREGDGNVLPLNNVKLSCGRSIWVEAMPLMHFAGLRHAPVFLARGDEFGQQ